MRISDWSSDVCSSDLFGLVVAKIVERQRARPLIDVGKCLVQALIGHDGQQRAEDFVLHDGHVIADIEQQAVGHAPALSLRSEEHTSELQSLMRISYAVFCLKKKNHTNRLTTSSMTETKQTTQSL